MIQLHLSLLYLCTLVSFISAMIPEEFNVQRIVQKPDTSQSEPAVFRMDKDLYLHTKNDFSDLRLFNAQGQEVAFQVRLLSSNDTATSREIVPMKLLSFKKGSSSEATILFSRKKDAAAPEELLIQTPLNNFEKRVSVQGSKDQKHWVTLTENQLIFDYSQFIDLRNTSISFEKSDYDYFKVIIDSISDLKQSGFSRVLHQSTSRAQTTYTEFLQLQEPFRLDEITFFTLQRQINYGSHHMAHMDLIIDSTFNDTVNNSTIVLLSSDREPISKLTVSVSANNFSRQIKVFGTDDTTPNAPWVELASEEIFSIRFDNFRKEHSEILLNTTSRYPRYKLAVVNRDNQPVTITGVKGTGPRHEVVFFHNGMDSLQVCYKADSSSVPRYDIGTILQSAPVIQGNIWNLGDPVKKLSLQKQRPVSIFSSRNILTVVVSLMVIVLAVVLFKAVKKIEMK